MDRRASWQQMVKQMQEVAPRLFAAAQPDGIEHPDGHRQTTQTITALTLPEETNATRWGSRLVSRPWRTARTACGSPRCGKVSRAGRSSSSRPARLVVGAGRCHSEINGHAPHSGGLVESVRNSPRTMDSRTQRADGERFRVRAKLRYQSGDDWGPP